MNKVLLIDCDGVLTDGTLTIDRHGEKMFKKFHTRDVRAIRELIFNGWEVIIVSADDWPGIFYFAEKVGAEVLILKDKANVPYENYTVIGDDAWDIPMFKKADRCFCPADADILVQEYSHIEVLPKNGGCGVVAEVIRFLL